METLLHCTEILMFKQVLLKQVIFHVVFTMFVYTLIVISRKMCYIFTRDKKIYKK